MNLRDIFHRYMIYTTDERIFDTKADCENVLSRIKLKKTYIIV